MNIIRLGAVPATQKTNFKRNNNINPYSNYASSQDDYISQRKSVIKQIVTYLDSVGVKSKVDNKNALELEKLSKLPPEASEITDLILQYTNKISGSVDFGKIGATNIGQVEELEGNLRSGRDFNFSTSEISDFGNLKKVKGNMIVSPQQIANADFTGLKVDGNIYVSQNCKHPLSPYTKLDKFDKKALLGGFKVIAYEK